LARKSLAYVISDLTRSIDLAWNKLGVKRSSNNIEKATEVYERRKKN
jgi:hypothetical protein